MVKGVKSLCYNASGSAWSHTLNCRAFFLRVRWLKKDASKLVYGMVEFFHTQGKLRSTVHWRKRKNPLWLKQSHCCKYKWLHLLNLSQSCCSSHPPQLECAHLNWWEEKRRQHWYKHIQRSVLHKVCCWKASCKSKGSLTQGPALLVNSPRPQDIPVHRFSHALANVWEYDHVLNRALFHNLN